MNTERPKIIEFNKKYVSNLTLSSRRVSRRDERHYVELYIETLFTITNNFKLDFYFYQFLTNRYQPSFVEVHFNFCELLEKDRLFFGPALKKALGNHTCPIPPGNYDLRNMSILETPNGFPFTKGRIYCNGSVTENGVSHFVLYASIDMELKTIRI
ncbi:hypothetical protein B5X24_HaOG212261 [Helicoverpa armigera]|uniref:MD-2-related lipid-recognition domain-containing protein n=1 Tax=Helicoverpa armigera TaxID=29058 RepID=A0A2W1BGJ4_HELAM|nr:hypothetical protein B5X24_HaOG212261 [Helicoverpa armigera]